MTTGGLQEVIREFHVRAFGEELARVNFASREERWAYVHQLWGRIQRAKERTAGHARQAADPPGALPTPGPPTEGRRRTEPGTHRHAAAGGTISHATEPRGQAGLATVFWEVHRDLPREAPGDDASTLRALRLVGRLPDRPRILDVGCGPGAQTVLLARETGGHVTALDTHAPFLEGVTGRAVAAGVGHRVQTVSASMFAIPFEEASFDLIWSEGAIYIRGFAQGLPEWRSLLRPGGHLAVSEATWLTTDPPDEARRFWAEGYPAMTDVATNLRTAEAAGYEVVGHFPLPAEAWWAYYDPMEKRIADLRRQHPDAATELDDEQREIDLYRRCGDAYGYVFYVLRRPQMSSPQS